MGDLNIILLRDTSKNITLVVAMQWIKNGCFLGHVMKTMGTQRCVGPWLLRLYAPSKLLVASHDANTLFSLMQSPSTSQVVQAI